MQMDLDRLVIEDNEAAQRFEARLDGYSAVAEYMRVGETIVLTHTEVPEPLEGHGIAARLARTALEQARARHLTVVPLCQFMASYIRRHPEYQELVHPDYRNVDA